MWQPELPNLSGVHLPLSRSQIAKAAFIPMIIMVLIRPGLLFALLLTFLLLAGLVFGGAYLLHF
jgi:hypothetical protein